MRHILIILSILLLSPFLTSCEKYVGEYKDGKRNGQGTVTWSDGKNYIGEFKDGKFNGHGKLTWSDGKKYVGEWKNGTRWNGTFYDKNGNIIYKYVNGR